MPSVKSDLWNLEVRESIRTLQPYQPGKPIEETKREFGLTEVIKLASNENPLGPSPKATEAVREALSLGHLYPDASHHDLKKALAERLGCTTDEVSIGNGSNEHIDLLIRVFVEPGKNLVTHRGAFIAYKLCAQLQGVQCKEAPLDEEFRPQVKKLLESIDANTRLMILANPNNPTGSFLNRDDIETLAKETLKQKVLLVLDSAYWEYVDDPALPDPMEIYRKYPNVIVLRTFSKIYGLAGYRVGYAVARKEVTAFVERSRQPFNINAFALVAAKAALNDESFLQRSKSLNLSSRVELEKGLSQFRVVVYPTQGNFLFVDFCRPSSELFPEFLKRGVILRPVAGYGFATHFRITCGLPTENRKLLEAVKEILQ